MNSLVYVNGGPDLGNHNAHIAHRTIEPYETTDTATSWFFYEVEEDDCDSLCYDITRTVARDGSETWSVLEQWGGDENSYTPNMSLQVLRTSLSIAKVTLGESGL